MESAHSPVGPSAAPYFVNCSGSVGLCATVTEEDTGAQLEGDAAHELGAHALRTGSWVSAGIQLSNGYIVTTDMLDYVGLYMEDILVFDNRLSPLIQ